VRFRSRLGARALTDRHRTARRDIDMAHNPFVQTRKLFASPEMAACAPEDPRCLYDHMAAFFSHAADGLRRAHAAGGAGALHIELVLGDAYDVMDQVSTLVRTKGSR
jgi:hypothetical protein